MNAQRAQIAAQSTQPAVLPRVMAIHDLSGVGKCSLTVALPILSAMGASVAALPTAILSTHTGGIAGYTYRDLTDDLSPVAEHWRSLGLRFDALYSGWLGSAAQSEIVLSVFDRFADQQPLILVDPVMGDEGRLYGTYTADRAHGMVALCARADVITPNLTEAALLLGEPYRDTPIGEVDARAMCRRLATLGPSRVVITGMPMGGGVLGAAAWDARTERFTLHGRPYVPGTWYGTGDIFASVLLGSLLHGTALADAAALAVDFVHGCIERTAARGDDPRFGVDFEHGLPALWEAVQRIGDKRL